MNITDVNHKADVTIRVDRVGQQLCLIEQVLAVGPIAEDGDRQFVIVMVPIVGNRRVINDERKSKQTSRKHWAFHGFLLRIPTDAQGARDRDCLLYTSDAADE